jgi:hypothetical protein
LGDHSRVATTCHGDLGPKPQKKQRYHRHCRQPTDRPFMLNIAVVLRSLPSPPSVGGAVPTLSRPPRHGSQSNDGDADNWGTPRMRRANESQRRRSARHLVRARHCPREASLGRPPLMVRPPSCCNRFRGAPRCGTQPADEQSTGPPV